MSIIIVDNRSNGQSSDTLVKTLEKSPVNNNPKVLYTSGRYSLNFEISGLIDGSTTSMQLMSGVGLMAENTDWYLRSSLMNLI